MLPLNYYQLLSAVSILANSYKTYLSIVLFSVILFTSGCSSTKKANKPFRQQVGVVSNFKFGLGSSYTGSIDNGLPNGKGKIHFFNGDRYEGVFKNGFMNGRGKYFFSDGTIYEGFFKLDSFVDGGVLTFNDKSQYQGQYQFRSASGNGVISKLSEVYKGSVKNSKPHGKGVVFKQGTITSGTWKNGLKNGEFISTNKGVIVLVSYENGKKEGLEVRLNSNYENKGVEFFLNGNKSKRKKLKEYFQDIYSHKVNQAVTDIRRSAHTEISTLKDKVDSNNRSSSSPIIGLKRLSSQIMQKCNCNQFAGNKCEQANSGISLTRYYSCVFKGPDHRRKYCVKGKCFSGKSASRDCDDYIDELVRINKEKAKLAREKRKIEREKADLIKKESARFCSKIKELGIYRQANTISSTAEFEKRLMLAAEQFKAGNLKLDKEIQQLFVLVKQSEQVKQQVRRYEEQINELTERTNQRVAELEESANSIMQMNIQRAQLEEQRIGQLKKEAKLEAELKLAKQAEVLRKRAELKLQQCKALEDPAGQCECYPLLGITNSPGKTCHVN